MKIVKIQLTVLWDAHCNWNTVCSLFVALSWFQFLLPPNYTSYDLQFHFASQCIKAGWKVFNMSAGSVKLRSSITVVFLFIAPLRRLQNDLSEIWAWTVVSDLTPLRPMHNTLDWCVKWYGSWLLHISQRCCVKSVWPHKSSFFSPSDLKVKIGDQRLTAHKFVLAARSEIWSSANMASTTELDLSGNNGFSVSYNLH